MWLATELQALHLGGRAVGLSHTASMHAPTGENYSTSSRRYTFAVPRLRTDDVRLGRSGVELVGDEGSSSPTTHASCPGWIL